MFGNKLGLPMSSVAERSHVFAKPKLHESRMPGVNSLMGNRTTRSLMRQVAMWFSRLEPGRVFRGKVKTKALSQGRRPKGDGL